MNNVHLQKVRDGSRPRVTHLDGVLGKKLGDQRRGKLVIPARCINEISGLVRLGRVG